MGKGKSSGTRESLVKRGLEEPELRFLKSGATKGYLVLSPLKKFNKRAQLEIIDNLIAGSLVDEHEHKHFITSASGTREAETTVRYFLTPKGKRLVEAQLKKDNKKKAALDRARVLKRMEKAFAGHNFSTLSLAARDILTHILIESEKKGVVFTPNQEYFKTQLGLSPNMVREALKELKLRTLVNKQEAIKGNKWNPGSPTHYRLSTAGERLKTLLKGYAKYKGLKFEKACSNIIYSSGSGK